MSALAGGVKVAYEEESGLGLEPRRDTGEPLLARSYFWYVPYAMTRKNQLGNVIAAEEAVDRVSLMKMMTSWSSEFVGRPDMIGTLEPGKWADYVVLSKDYFTVPMEQIRESIPLMTVLGGKTVVLRAEFAAELGTQPVGPQLTFTTKPPR